MFAVAWTVLLMNCRSGPDAGPTSNPEELPAMSFLLPAPFAPTDAAGEFAREQSLRLFSAPVLDPAAIEALAARYELRSRALLSERHAQLIQIVCKLEPARRRDAIQAYEIQRQRQWNRWLNLQQRYEASLKYRLSRDVHEDDAAAGARLTTLLGARAAVQALQRERQQLVSESYESLLATLGRRVPGGPDADAACDAPIPPIRGNGGSEAATAAETGSAIAPGQPTEYLYLPYYLALYRFLSLLPPDQRSRLLLALHSGKPSDN
ncbi:MAG: hypothetical protein RIF32_03650 [Leptospirales bacterium]